ncbi:MAG: DUF2383 domain-containing protein [Verrucomicrobiota bacterium]
MTSTDSTTEILNALLRGELSAIETYSTAIHKFPVTDAVAVLEHMRSDHLASVSTLRALITGRGGKPSTDSGAWGNFAKAVESTASLFGPTSAISALKQGEKHGIGEYEEALEDDSVPGDVKQVLRDKLLPPLQRHLLNLESLSG